jgi:hypothetical protein
MNESLFDGPEDVHMYYSLLLTIIPFATVFGNLLVILAVAKERTLQTVTNMLIVSLAVSDLFIALFVMTFAVYFEWNAFFWDLGSNLCKLYIGADVALSTASILNLLAISLDRLVHLTEFPQILSRYVAISHPIIYAQYGSRASRAFISILLVWGISASVALPILFGANPLDNNVC